MGGGAPTRWLGGEWSLGDCRGGPPLGWSARAFLGPHLRAARPAATGRAALRQAVTALGAAGRPVLLPAYACAALTQAVAAAGSPAVYYPGDALLRPRWPEVSALARRHGARLAVIVHAFGVLQDMDPVRRLGVPVIEDCSHTLANAPGARWLGPPATVAAVASLRKALPVPAGGLWAVWDRCGPDPAAPRPNPFARARASALALAPGSARREAILAAESRVDGTWIDGGLDPLSAAALEALAAAGPHLLARWRRARRAQAAALVTALGGTACRPLWPELPPGVCPLGVPVRHPERTLLARWLLGRGVEAALHWPVPEAARPALSREERLLAGTILTLPCPAGC